MSDLAPFVAAAIRDRVVEDMAKEIGDLKKQKEEELAPWTVIVHGPDPPDGGEPVVYAWARISMKDVLKQTLRRRRRTIRHDLSAYLVISKFEYTDHPLRWGDFLSSFVSIVCNRDSGAGSVLLPSNYKHRVSFNRDGAEVGRGFGVTRKEDENGVIANEIWINWWFSRDVNGIREEVVEDFEVGIPIAPEHQEIITPEVAREVHSLREDVFPFTSEAAGDDAPVRFIRMNFDAQGLLSLLVGDDESESDEDNEDDNDDSEDDDGDHGNNDDMSIGE